MKKLLISMLLLAPMLAGCANVDTKITINNDRSASIATSVSYEGDLSDESDPNAVLIHENYSNYLDPSYQVEKDFNSKLSTITATKNVKDLRRNDLDLSSLGFTSNLPDKRFIEYRKSFLVRSFNIDCTYDYGKQLEKYKNIKVDNDVKKQEDQKGLQPEYYQRYADKSEMETEDNDFIDNVDETVLPPKEPKEDEKQASKDEKNNTFAPVESKPSTSSISIQLPAPAFYNNADSSEGNLYTWNIKTDEPTEIKLQYVQYNGWAIAFIILAGIVILVLGALKIIKHENQKRVGNTDNLAK